jgi:hypothetical protein
MRKATLQFLRRESSEIRSDIQLLESGQREILEVDRTERKNVTARVIQLMLDRLGRFEEMIAAYEAGI